MELTPMKRSVEPQSLTPDSEPPTKQLHVSSNDAGAELHLESPSSIHTPANGASPTPAAFPVAEKLSAKEKKLAEREAERQRKAAERDAERRRKEDEKKAERERKEAERLAEKERKEMERKAEKERKEAERLAEKERKEAERLAEKERKEAEKLADKERKEAEKRAEEEKARASQPRINSFFSKKKAASKSIPKSSTPDVSDPSSESAYSRTFLEYAPKPNSRVFNGVSSESSLDDPAEWLKAQRCCISEPSKPLTVSDFRTRLAAASTPEEILALLSQLRIRHLQFYENNRPPYVGSTPDVEKSSVLALAIEPTRTDLIPSLVYEYDSDAEWVDEEDGEEIGDDNLSDDEGDSDASLNDFIAEEEEQNPQRRPIAVGPMAPVVQWGPQPDLEQFSIEFLVPSTSPFERRPESVTAKPLGDSKTDTSIPTTGGTNSSQETASLQPPPIDPEVMHKILAKVHGSEGNQTLLVELLKRDFPDMKKATIVQTVKACAQRVGTKEKRWELLPQYQALLVNHNEKPE